MSRRVLVITPTYNERENLEAFVGLLRASAPEAEVLVVDDNSPDGTGQIADALAAKDARIHVMHRPAKQGLGTAYPQGFRWALARGFDVVFEMDTDLSHDPRYVPDFLAAIDAGGDVIIGSRNIPGGGVEGWGLGRHLLSKGGSLYSRTILGVRLRDLTSGFVGYRRAALEGIGLESIRSNGYSFQIEMKFRSLRAGYRVVEHPIVFVDRRVGQSKMSRQIFAEALTMVWKMRLGL